MRAPATTTEVTRGPLGWQKQVYRAAIDATAGEREGVDWWAAVMREVDAVVAAPDARAASRIIAWWHHDWLAVGDSPVHAARRLRAAAARAVRGHRAS
jgi:hypothetical protein